MKDSLATAGRGDNFTRLAQQLGGWDVAEFWTDADRLFAIFGLAAAELAQGS